MQEERGKLIGGGMWACKGTGAQMSSHQQSQEGSRDLDLANKLVEMMKQCLQYLVSCVASSLGPQRH